MSEKILGQMKILPKKNFLKAVIPKKIFPKILDYAILVTFIPKIILLRPLTVAVRISIRVVGTGQLK